MKLLLLHAVFLAVAPVFCLAVPSASAGAQTAISVEAGLKKTVSLLITARNRIVLQHNNRRQVQVLPDSETDELKIFLAYLDGRIVHYCREIHRLYGADALSDSPCPAHISDSDAVSEYDPAEAMARQTEDEAAATLEGSFEASLHQFDELLLEEQEKIAGTVPRQRETVNEKEDGPEGSHRGENQSGPGRNDKGGENNHEPIAGLKEPNGRTTTYGNSKTTHKPPTQGTKDLSQTDDDIVAKQLREAAEQETDPEVKEKLWEEYYNYKEGTR